MIAVEVNETAVPAHIVLLPVAAMLTEGITVVVVVTARVLAALVPQLFVPVTLIVPLPVPVVAVNDCVVPVPVHPEGSVQV